MLAAMTVAVACVVPTPAKLGEGPIWSVAEGLLWWVDIKGPTANAFDPQNGSNRSWPLPADVGTIVPRTGGGCVVALRDGLAVLDPATGRLRDLGATHAHAPGTGFRFNDGKCDAAGRLWVGTLNEVGVAGAAHLYCYDPARGMRRLVEGITCSNGITWSADGRTMYYVDSPTFALDAFAFDPATGSLSDRRTVVRFAKDKGGPDGIAIDAEGMLWVGLWDGWRVQRCDPRTGDLLAHIEVPAARVTACAFGGARLEDLYITTASPGKPDDRATQPLAGCLFRCQPGVAGLPTYSFNG